ncbi:MAG: DUF3943 domain-containing protein [Pontiella sp.]|nr:DUF3943 domain-containing protein [Pontiella sp.]
MLFILGSATTAKASGHGSSGMETNGVLELPSYWTLLEIDPAIYDTPYRISLLDPRNGEDGVRVWSQTRCIFLYGVAAVAIIAAMPEDFTGWNPGSNLLKNYEENLTEGPVWDRDEWFINYIGHPYFGGVFYQIARKSGYRQWDAFIYTFLMSTFYWEYGVEAFAETPSIQDLVVHPLLGWVYGEWAFQTEQDIREQGGEIAGSRMLGTLALWLLDPVDALGSGINAVTGLQLIDSGSGYLSYTALPADATTDHRVYLNMNFPLGGERDKPAGKPRAIDYRNDPVDTGIVGISIGSGHTILDKKWNIKDEYLTTVTLGLYFSPRLSTRLDYANGKFDERVTGRSLRYENYSLGTQYYFNARRKLRPYVTVGFGEQLLAKNRANKTFQLNGGLGLHLRLHHKWSLQTDWISYFGPEQETHDQRISANLVYRFGRGEHSEW